MNAQIDPNSPQGGRQTVDPLTGNIYVRASFADEVRGPAPKDIDLTLAQMSKDVYRSDDRQRSEIAGWKPLSDDQFRKVGIDPALRTNDASGFDADIYTDGRGRYALAFRGTDAGKDWATNLGQGIGLETAQYNQAITLSRQAKVAFGDELVITGHSLGGGLAAVGAAAAETPAVTFNAAGVKDKTLERIGLDASAVKDQAENGQMRRYAVDNEILTGLQERNIVTKHLLPDAIGNKVSLPDPDPLSFWQNLNPVKSVKHGIEMHMMDSVIRAQEKAFGHGIGENGLMSHPDHAFNPQYQRVFDQLQPQLEERGIGIRESQNAAGVLALEAQRSGIVPDRIVANGERVFAVQGAQPESQRYAQVDLQTSMQVPLMESSKMSLGLIMAQQQSNPQPANPQQQTNAPQSPDPAQDQQAAPLRARL
jgi:hypothetical protein